MFIFLNFLINFLFQICQHEVHLSNIDYKSKEDGHYLTKTDLVPKLGLVLSISLCAVCGWTAHKAPSRIFFCEIEKPSMIFSHLQYGHEQSQTKISWLSPPSRQISRLPKTFYVACMAACNISEIMQIIILCDYFHDVASYIRKWKIQTRFKKWLQNTVQ